MIPKASYLKKRGIAREQSLLGTRCTSPYGHIKQENATKQHIMLYYTICIGCPSYYKPLNQDIQPSSTALDC